MLLILCFVWFLLLFQLCNILGCHGLIYGLFSGLHLYLPLITLFCLFLTFAMYDSTSTFLSKEMFCHTLAACIFLKAYPDTQFIMWANIIFQISPLNFTFLNTSDFCLVAMALLCFNRLSTLNLSNYFASWNAHLFSCLFLVSNRLKQQSKSKLSKRKVVFYLILLKEVPLQRKIYTF